MRKWGSILFAVLSLSGCTAKVSFAPSSSASETPVTSQEEESTNLFETRLRSGGRNFVSSTLRQVFDISSLPAGTQSTLDTFITNNVERQIKGFGGDPCDPNYVEFVAGQEALKDSAPLTATTSECDRIYAQGLRPAPGQSLAEAVPFSSPIRAGLIQRVCDKIAEQDDAINAAVTQLGLSTSAVPTSSETALVFDSFYPGRTPTSAVTTALASVVAQAQTLYPADPIEAWRFLFVTLCYSPGWQVP